jgi:hypothetical protein
MARKKQPENGQVTATAETGPPGDAQEPAQPEQTSVNQPAFQVGPIPTSKTEAVSVAVWGNVIQVDGREVTVYSVTAECRYQADGQWKSGRSFKGSQIYALQYGLQRASDWILAQRDPSDVPF